MSKGDLITCQRWKLLRNSEEIKDMFQIGGVPGFLDKFHFMAANFTQWIDKGRRNRQLI